VQHNIINNNIVCVIEARSLLISSYLHQMLQSLNNINYIEYVFLYRSKPTVIFTTAFVEVIENIPPGV